MKIALVGYGKMGRVVEEQATKARIEICERFRRDHPLRDDDVTREALQDVDALVDFSAPEAVPTTVRAAAALGKPLVVGTTGWGEHLDAIRTEVARSGLGVVRAANFSLGVNVFYRLAEQAAQLLARLEDYDPFITDWHHRFKKDAPSGTALEIRRRMATAYGEREISITSQRAGYVPSVHTVGFDSPADTIRLEHQARNRIGFADGALLAARWLPGRKGFFDFQEVLDDLLARPRTTVLDDGR